MESQNPEFSNNPENWDNTFTSLTNQSSVDDQ